jgi:Ni,Fe-hydrogenase I small subunit
MGVPQVSIASASYGWVLERGVGVLMVTGSLAAGPIGQYCTVGGLGNAALETKAGEGTRALTFAAEAATPAGVSAILI